MAKRSDIDARGDVYDGLICEKNANFDTNQ